MTNNILGLIVSYLFVFTVIGLSTLLLKIKVLSIEGSRKFIHIGVSNWWFLAMYFFDQPMIASIPPLTFIVLNYLSYRFQIVDAMERNESKNDLGTVYYAISLFVLTLISFQHTSTEFIGGMGILVMGYGDGIAALIGKNYGTIKYKVGNTYKSIEGTLAMFIVTTVVISLMLFNFSDLSTTLILIYTVIISVIATITESFTKSGFDNITVPFVVSMTFVILNIII